jgi:hypothetical protein
MTRLEIESNDCNSYVVPEYNRKSVCNGECGTRESDENSDLGKNSY